MNNDFSPTPAARFAFMPGRDTPARRQASIAGPENERKRRASAGEEGHLGRLPCHKRGADGADFSPTPQELDAADALLALGTPPIAGGTVRPPPTFAQGPMHFVYACGALAQEDRARIIQRLGSLGAFGRHFGLKSVYNNLDSNGVLRESHGAQFDTAKFDAWMRAAPDSEFAAYVTQTRDYLQSLVEASRTAVRPTDLLHAYRSLSPAERQTLLAHWSLRDVCRLFCDNARALICYVTAGGDFLGTAGNPKQRPAPERQPTIDATAATLRRLMNGPPGVERPQQA